MLARKQGTILSPTRLSENIPASSFLGYISEKVFSEFKDWYFITRFSQP